MRSTAVVFATTMLGVACSMGGGPADSSSVSQAGAASATEVAAVQRAIDSALVIFVTGMEKGDATAMASVFADDGIVMAPGAKAARGPSEIVAAYTGMFSAFSVPDASIRTTDLIVAGNYAIETGVYEMTTQPKTGKAVRDVGKYVSVWRREADGSWKMIRDIFNPDGTT